MVLRVKVLVKKKHFLKNLIRRFGCTHSSYCFRTMKLNKSNHLYTSAHVTHILSSK